MASLLRLRLKPERRELRTFGIAGALIVLVVTAVRWHGQLIWQSEAGAGGATLLLALALAAPSLLRPLYIGLSVATYPIGWVVSHVLLGVLFYGIITPLGLVFRLFGRDRMSRRRDPSAASYFTPRARDKDKRGYFRQY